MARLAIDSRVGRTRRRATAVPDECSPGGRRTPAGRRQNSAYRTTPAPLPLQTSILPLITFMLLWGAAPSRGASLAVAETLAVRAPSGERLEGRLDWTAGTLTVTGEAAAGDGASPAQQRLTAFRAARTAALTGLVEVVRGVRVDARTTVGAAMRSDAKVRRRVRELALNARVVPGSRREEEGLCRLDVRLPLLGDLARAVLPPAPDALVSMPPTALPERDSLIVFVPGGPYTGLVVDARGTGLRASLSPRIVDPRGRVIYAAGHVDRRLAVRQGLAGWERDLRRAILSGRVHGEPAHPFLVEVTRVSGGHRTDAVIGAEDGTRLQMADLQGDFLARGRVVFVIGPRPPTPEPVAAAAPAAADTAGMPDSLTALAGADTAGLPDSLTARADADTAGMADSLAAPVVYRDFLDSLLHARARALADTLPDPESIAP